MDLRSGLSVVLLFVVFVIALAIGADVLDQVRDTQTVDSIAYNASTNGLTGVDNVSSWSGTIGTVIGASIILTVLVGGFAILWTRGR